MITRERRSGPRRYLMCPPEHFAVTYAINPWMAPDQPTDAALALRQWSRLRQAYLDLGHEGRTIAPVPGLPALGVGSLRLPAPRFSHLDTALCGLDADTAMYYPAAFDDAGRAALAARFA